MKARDRFQSVELILADVDGVLTDGGIYLDNNGIEGKKFDIRDGVAIKAWARAGGRFGLVTGRNSQIVIIRAAELGIEIVRQGVEEKLAIVQAIAADLNLTPEQVCYVGDDLPDLTAIHWAGLGVAVKNACAEVQSAANITTSRSGGDGAIRELVEIILKNQGRWDDVVRRFS